MSYTSPCFAWGGIASLARCIADTHHDHAKHEHEDSNKYVHDKKRGLLGIDMKLANVYDGKGVMPTAITAVIILGVFGAHSIGVSGIIYVEIYDFAAMITLDVHVIV